MMTSRVTTRGGTGGGGEACAGALTGSGLSGAALCCTRRARRPRCTCNALGTRSGEDRAARHEAGCWDCTNRSTWPCCACVRSWPSSSHSMIASCSLLLAPLMLSSSAADEPGGPRRGQTGRSSMRRGHPSRRAAPAGAGCAGPVAGRATGERAEAAAEEGTGEIIPCVAPVFTACVVWWPLGCVYAAVTCSCCGPAPLRCFSIVSLLQALTPPTSVRGPPLLPWTSPPGAQLTIARRRGLR